MLPYSNGYYDFTKSTSMFNTIEVNQRRKKSLKLYVCPLLMFPLQINSVLDIPSKILNYLFQYVYVNLIKTNKYSATKLLIQLAG